MSQVAMSARRTITRYRVSVFVRGDDEYAWDWRYCGDHRTHSRAGIALTEWLLENDALPGRYRIEGDDGSSATCNYDGEETAA